MGGEHLRPRAPAAWDVVASASRNRMLAREAVTGPTAAASNEAPSTRSWKHALLPAVKALPIKPMMPHCSHLPTDSVVKQCGKWAKAMKAAYQLRFARLAAACESQAVAWNLKWHAGDVGGRTAAPERQLRAAVQHSGAPAHTSPLKLLSREQSVGVTRSYHLGSKAHLRSRCAPPLLDPLQLVCQAATTTN